THRRQPMLRWSLTKPSPFPEMCTRPHRRAGHRGTRARCERQSAMQRAAGRERMRVIARFAGPQGEIAIIEKLTTGMRVYREGGVEQSCVLPGGEAGVDYVCLMAALLAGARRALLLGCGGGALGGMLHRRGTTVTVVDSNPISFELARMFFWMPDG